jgi:uncharacterized protein YjiS (DUF1127 family)
MTTLPLSSRLASGIGTLLRPITHRRTLEQLNRLDDHMLRDIGLRRLDVDIMRRMW